MATEFESEVKALKPALRKHVQRITDPDDGGFPEIWKWVNDSNNAHYVRDLAVKHLTSLYTTRQRSDVRRIERASTSIVANALPSSTRYVAPEYTEEQLAEFERKWDEARKNKEAQERAARERMLRELQDANPGVDLSGLTPEQTELAHLGFPVSNFYLGDERVAKRESFRHRPDYKWLDEWGFKGKRKAAVERVERADDREFGMFRRVTSALEEYKSHLHAEWSAELLSQSFVVDGVAVTWASATVAQHRTRANELSEHALGTLQTAALHERAIADITTAGADSLADLTMVAA